ncbi:MAG: hypothetical protein WC545_03705 [Patescibacteria group bacterium]
MGNNKKWREEIWYETSVAEGDPQNGNISYKSLGIFPAAEEAIYASFQINKKNGGIKPNKLIPIRVITNGKKAFMLANEQEIMPAKLPRKAQKEMKKFLRHEQNRVWAELAKRNEK